jgi:type II secretory pathway pseudopilin PulG/DNA-binding CsgD family transcriptional regulator
MKIDNVSFINYFFTIFSFLFFNTIEAQKTNQELLQLINNKNTLQENKFQYLCDISFNYAEVDSVKAYDYANKALHLAKESNSLNKEIIAYDYIATVARRGNNVKKQIEIADKCNLIAKNSKDEEVIAYCNFLTACKYYLINDKEKYVFYVLKSFNYFEKTKKRYDKLVAGYAILSRNFMENENISIFEKYSKKALQLGKESNNDILEAKGLNIWAAFIKYKAEDQEIVNKTLLDSSSNCYLKAIHIIESKSQYMTTNSRDHARGYINLANNYMSYLDDKKLSKKILPYLKKAEDISLKNNNNDALMVIYGSKSNFYIETKNIPEAEKALKKLEFYTTNESKSNPINGVRVYNSFMNLSKLKNDFEGYQKYFKMYEKAKTDQHNKDNNDAIYNASIKFETEQKIKEIKSLTTIAEERKKINYLLIVLSILSLLTLILMYKTFRFRRKTYELKLKSNENEAISNMLELEIANRERKIAIQEKLLTDQQKEKLQHELMTNNLQLENKKDILKDIQQKLSLIKSSELKSISRTINKSIEIDEEFELLKSSFENTNPEFFSTLQGKSLNSLTKLDLKYCGYIKLGLGIKEMANIMNIEPKSMKMARYRLRQKLDLKKEEDLDDFVNSI